MFQTLPRPSFGGPLNRKLLAEQRQRHLERERIRIQEETRQRLIREAKRRKRLDVLLAKLTAPLPTLAPAPDINEPLPRRQPGREIVRETANLHGFLVDDLRGRSQARKIVDARQEAFYRLKCETDLSFAQMGALLGWRDHSTAISGIRAHCKRNRIPLPRGMEPERVKGEGRCL